MIMMMMLKCWCVLVVFIALLRIARGEDYSERDDEERQAAAGRAMKDDFGVDQWKAVQPHQIDSSGWIGSDADSEDQQPRRRLRKRKRRPEVTPEMQVRPRRRRPVRLDEARDTWKELEAETPKRTYNRRRISPVYLPVSATTKYVEDTYNQGRRQEINEDNEKKSGKGRRKDSLTEGNDNQGRRQDGSGMGRRRRLRTSTTSTTTPPPATVVDIKNLIKQNGGMSLSEILQKRNLSLTDLLKGKQQAISALTHNSVKSSQKYLSTKLFENEKPDDALDNNNGFKQNDEWRLERDDRNKQGKLTHTHKQPEEDQFIQTDRPIKIKISDLRQTERATVNDWRPTEKSSSAMSDWMHTEETSMDEEDRFKQTETPLKVTVNWKLNDDSKPTENPLKVMLNWRLTEENNLRTTVKPVNSEGSMMLNDHEDDDDWKHTENPMKAIVDWRLTEEEQTGKDSIDWRESQDEPPVKMVNEWLQTDKPRIPSEEDSTSKSPLDIMQQTERSNAPKVVTSNIMSKHPLEAENEADGDVTIVRDMLETQKKRVGILYKHSGHKIHSDSDVVTEPATDKRIFVPSHPKYYTSLNYKPDFGIEQTMRTTTIETPVTTRKPKLPLTSAKLLQSAKKETLPPKPIKISFSDILGFTPDAENDTRKKEDVGPLKMLFDLEELVKQDLDSNTVIPLETTSLGYTSTKSPEIEYTTQLVQEKMRAVSAKDEIMEILKDEDTKMHLSRILEVRNMTVDELVEQRERGSSQRHLADIFHNKTKEPEPVLEHVGEIKMMRKGKTVKQEVDLKPLPDVSISSEELMSSERIPGTSFPTYKIETNKIFKENPPMPIPVWKTIYPSILTKEVVSEEIPVIEEIENTISEAVNEELTNDLTKTNYDYDEYVQLPLGVKSAIFASLAIIGISLIVFLTILIIFKWAQRQKQRMCYPGTFKAPILQSDSRRSIRTFVSETLGRKKNVYTSRLQSMSDSWDGEKPYQ